MRGSVVFGVVIGSVEAPCVGYLDEPVATTPELLARAGPVKPTEVFRFAAPCAESACQHFDGSKCRLAQKIVQLVPAVIEILPACKVRASCRWWLQEGKAACLRCPGVVTEDYRPSDEIREAARPAAPGAPSF